NEDTMANPTELLLDNDGVVATFTLNRPDKLNALSAGLLRELAAAFAAVARTPLRAAIVTGAGKAFSAGGDITERRGMATIEAKRRADEGHALAALIESASFPVIAAVNGFALGGGCELALACDFIYAADTAKFGQPEVNLGVIPGFGGTQRLARRVGIGVARELVFTGEIIRSARAVGNGLVDAGVPHDGLMTRLRAVGGTDAA